MSNYIAYSNEVEPSGFLEYLVALSFINMNFCIYFVDILRGKIRTVATYRHSTS
jgi:hypothetical protein